MTKMLASGRDQTKNGPGWHPGPESRLVALGLSGVARGTSLRHGGLTPPRGPRSDGLGLRGWFRRGRRHLGGHSATVGVRVKEREFGRGERSRTARTDLSVPASLRLDIELAGRDEWLRASTA